MAKTTETITQDGEVVEQKANALAVATSDNALLSALDLGPGLEIVGMKTVTRPVLQQIDNVPFGVKIISKIQESNIDTGRRSREGEAKMAPAKICHVLNLKTGEEQTLIANAAMQSGLEDNYPDGSYVGKCFAMVGRLKPHDGGKKQIREYIIREIEVKGL